MSAARDPCPDCQLPFYTDRYSECPYCGSTPAGAGETADASDAAVGGTTAIGPTPAGSVAGPTPPERPRTTCSNCGLPHYADTGSGCPYCAGAGVGPDQGATASSTDAAASASPSVPGSSDASAAPDSSPAATDEAGTDRPSGVLGRLRRLFGS